VIPSHRLFPEAAAISLVRTKWIAASPDGEAPLKGGWLRAIWWRETWHCRRWRRSSCQLPSTWRCKGYGGAMARSAHITLFNVVAGDANRRVIKAPQQRCRTLGARGRWTAIAAIETVQKPPCRPARRRATPDTPTARYRAALKSLATTIKLDLGLEVATVDYGGWDHHVNLNGQFPPQARELSQSLQAF